MRHGAKVKRCSIEGCTNQVKRGGVCGRHGAYNSQDESTAFGSEYEKATATRALTNQQRASGAVLRSSERRSVPREVSILCQQVAEV